jgi:hypothetical protein
MEWSDLKATLWSWLLVPLASLEWWIAWSRLPERVVMKQGPNGRPTSWATREQAMTFDLVLLAGILAFSTVLTLVVAFAQPQKATRVSIGTAACNTFVFLVLSGVLWFVQVP